MFGPAQASGGFDQPFNGLISEVAYFKQCLSDVEMTRLAMPESGYVELVRSWKPSGYWRLNETVTGKVMIGLWMSNVAKSTLSLTAGELS